MGKIARRVDIGHFLEVKRQIVENIEEMRRLHAKNKELISTLCFDHHFSSVRHEYDSVLADIFGTLNTRYLNLPSNLKGDEARNKIVNKLIDHGIWSDFYRRVEIWKILGEDKHREFSKLRETPSAIPEFTAENAASTLQGVAIDRGKFLFERIVSVLRAQLETNYKTNKRPEIGEKIILEGCTGSEFERIELLVFDILGLTVPEYNKRLSSQVGTAALYKVAAEGENEVLRMRRFKNGNVHVWFIGEGLRALDIINETIHTFYKKELKNKGR